MPERNRALTEAELLCVVPAGGLGSRLGELTVDRAKPSLAISFNRDGEVRRMIDVPLQTIRELGGAALVSLLYAPESLSFVDDYPHAETVLECRPGGPVDTMLEHLDLLEASRASVIGIVPGDAYVDQDMLEGMKAALERSHANAAILSTRHLEGHNVRPITQHGIMTTARNGTDFIADLGVHMIKREWLIDRLRHFQPEAANRSIDIWSDIYSVSDPATDILMYVPPADPVWIDMGTGPAFHRMVSELNRVHSDASGNVVFPGARIANVSSQTVALPNSFSPYPLDRVIIPEGRNIATSDEVLKG